MRILYIDIDSLRPDHLGAYGYSRPTSPTIDSVAKAGVRFTQYFASDTPCVPSRAALMSGRPGIRNGVVAHEDTLAGATFRYTTKDRDGGCPTLMHHLARHGYQTISFSSFANRHLAGWFHFGFREFYLDSLKNGNENADEVNAVAEPWFEQHAQKDNWFVHLNYWDPHTLYTEPLEYMEAMAKYEGPAWPDQHTINHQRENDLGIRSARDIWSTNSFEAGGENAPPTMPRQLKTRDDYLHLMNGYDGAIRYCDDHIARILEILERDGVREETAIIISADHGESFGELGQYMEHGTASPATQRVPLIVQWLGLTDALAGSERSDLSLNIDFAPTIAEGLGLPVPPEWAGESLVSALKGKAGPERPHVVWGHGLHTRQRAVFDGHWLLVRTYHPSFYGYPPRMLFNLDVDPHQTNDLAASEKAVASRLEHLLTEWETSELKATGEPDPMRLIQDQAPSLIGSTDDYLARLEEEGRPKDAERIRASLARVNEDYL